MNKIQEEFKKWMKAERRVWTSLCKTNFDLDEDGRFEDSEVFMFFISYKEGKQSADLLPTEKDCPECGGDGVTWEVGRSGHNYPRIKCPKCKGTKVIPLYYTPEQYEKIMGKPYPEECLVWRRHIKGWYSAFYGLAKGMKYLVIVQTAQPAPPADYRPEEI